MHPVLLRHFSLDQRGGANNQLASAVTPRAILLELKIGLQ